jgi:multidrug/hemolysin transport system ATP-binding protein
MEEAAEADQVVIIDAGRVVARGTPLELKKCYSGDFITLYGTDEDTVRSLGKSYEKISGAYRLSVANTAEATALITSHPDVFVDYEIIKGRMDDVFLAATGKMLSGGEEK